MFEDPLVCQNILKYSKEKGLIELAFCFSLPITKR